MDKIKRLVLSPLTFAVLAVPVILVAIWQVPQWQTSSVKFSTPDKRADVENAYRITLIQALGGTFLFITAYFSWRNLKATEEKQITERYSKSIEQLGDDKIEVRLGGIYALERIAKDSPKDHWTIMEVLTSFVQEKSPLLENKNNQAEEPKTEEKQFQRITKDVQAALTVIGRRNVSKDPTDQRLDLSFTYLRGASLIRANLSQTDLRGANLSEANLGNVNFSRANLSRANLLRTELLKANLEHAHLLSTNLSEANLAQASLKRANLWNTDFHDAVLAHADLSGALNLTIVQVKSAKNWKQAKYDPAFREKLGLPPKSTTEEENN